MASMPKTRTPTATDGGSGGPAIASDSATATDSTTTTATPGATAAAAGMAAKAIMLEEPAVAARVANATSTASINSNDFSLLSATANSFGGTGGAPGWSTGVIATAGHGGVGGNAISTALGLSTSDTWLRINSNATGGAGGSAFGSSNFGNGGAGGFGPRFLQRLFCRHADFLNDMFEADHQCIATGGKGGSAAEPPAPPLPKLEDPKALPPAPPVALLLIRSQVIEVERPRAVLMAFPPTPRGRRSRSPQYSSRARRRSAEGMAVADRSEKSLELMEAVEVALPPAPPLPALPALLPFAAIPAAAAVAPGCGCGGGVGCGGRVGGNRRSTAAAIGAVGVRVLGIDALAPLRRPACIA